MGIFKPLLSFKLPCLDIWGCEVSNLNRKKCNDLSFNKKKTVLEVWSYFTREHINLFCFYQEYLSCDYIIRKYFSCVMSFKHMQVVYSIYYCVWKCFITKQLRGRRVTVSYVSLTWLSGSVLSFKHFSKTAFVFFHCHLSLQLVF